MCEVSIARTGNDSSENHAAALFDFGDRDIYITECGPYFKLLKSLWEYNLPGNISIRQAIRDMIRYLAAAIPEPPIREEL